MEETLEQIKELLIKSGKLRNVVLNLNGYNGCLSDLDYYENGEDFFRTFFDNDIDEAVRAVSYGDYTYTDEYAIINVYGNVDSCNEYEYQNMLEESIDEIVDNLIELWDELDDWEKKDLPEEVVDLINQYKNNNLESEGE